MMDLNDLNPMQRKAATTLEGPVLILAGAGSGKTRTITYRIANLIQQGVKPWKILALTFTNKAAREMQSRVERLVGGEATDMWLGTFHSVCVRILRRDIEKLGYKRSFTIYDDDDQERVIKGALKALNIDEKELPVRSVSWAISDAKNKLLTPDEWFAQSARDYRCGQIHDVFISYEERLRSANALDFDDLIMKTLQLFADHPPVLDYYRDRFEYVHVDEYQDTNMAQYEFVRLLTAGSRNLCVVGDDDQAIYGWRGADIRNILDFEKDFPDATVIKLEQNYRSTANILDAANQVIAHNTGRKEKTLWTDDEAGDLIRLYSAGDEREEAAWICEQIRRQSKVTPYSEMAVLYRTHAQSRVIEEMLMRSGIPYKVFGGTRFYDRREVRDALAYLRLIVNPADDISLKRIINVPKRSIGDSTVAALDEEARREGVPVFSVLSCLPDTLGSRPRKCVGEFTNLIFELMSRKDQMKLSEYVDFVITKAGLKEQFENEEGEEAEARLQNLNEFIGSATEFEKQSDDKSLEAFLENVALVSDLDREAEAPRYVTLMTLHTAKGLEYETVFMAGMEEGIFPSARSLQEENRMEEERRLCYVGMTRAKKNLFLSCARRRLLYNQITHNAPSVFLREIPSRLLKDDFAGAQRAGAGYGTPVYSSYPQPPVRNAYPVRAQTPSAPAVKGGGLNIPGVTKGFGGAAVSDSMLAMYKPGDRVLHKKFGVGTVQSVTGKGAAARITIAFPVYGVREFSLAIAPIAKLEG
ncbi:MAG: DNA helicase PcrA [Clostridiales bacterium]|nr:DNA helicase PcrA [Clostridiales bacterium]